MAIIGYHISDDFQIPGNIERRDYYVYTGVPNVCIDGIYVNVNDSYYWYRLRFDERKVVESPLFLNITLEDYENPSGLGHVKVSATNVDDSEVVGQLRLVATGDDTVGTWGGFDHLSHTAVNIFPSAQGVPVDLQPGETFDTVQEFSIPSGWRNKPCTIVGFVQNDDTQEVLQAAILHEVVLGLSGEITGGELVLSWPSISQATHYWVHGASNQPTFQPGETNLLAVLQAGTTTWSSTAGIADPESNWIYIVRALDASHTIMTNSNRFGEYDFGLVAP